MKAEPDLKKAHQNRGSFLTVFFPNSVSQWGFSPDKLRCVPVRVAGAGSGGRFRKVPESSGVCWCIGSGGRFRKVPESSGVKWCRFRRQVPEDFGGFRCMPAEVQEVGSGTEGLGRFRRVLESSGACWCRFRRQGSEGSGEFRCGLLPCNLNRSSHVLVLITGIMGKTTAQKGAHVVKDGIRHKDVYATAVGDTSKAFFFSPTA